MGVEAVRAGHQGQAQGKGADKMMETMVRRSALGFLVGMPIGMAILVALSLVQTGGATLFTDALLVRCGNEAAALVVQTLLSGALGAVGMGATVAYDVERWGLLRAGLTHYGLYMAVLLPVAGLLGWVAWDVGEVAFLVGVTSLVQLAITWIMAVRCRAEVEELNVLLRDVRQVA